MADSQRRRVPDASRSGRDNIVIWQVLVIVALLATWEEETTGRRLLEHVAGRVWSSTWDIPDALMPEVLRLLTPRLEALLGDLDRPVLLQSRFTLAAA